MFELRNIAYPYAKAVFEFACFQKKIQHWQSMISFSANVSCDKNIKKIISNPIKKNQVANLFIEVCNNKIDIYCQNLIKIMAKNLRLKFLPNVLQQFIYLRSEYELISEIDVVSVNPLNKKQLDKIKSIMEKRLSKKVYLSNKIDNSIISGIIIRENNMVTNRSIKDRLNRLAIVLTN